MHTRPCAPGAVLGDGEVSGGGDAEAAAKMASGLISPEAMNSNFGEKKHYKEGDAEVGEMNLKLQEAFLEKVSLPHCVRTYSRRWLVSGIPLRPSPA